MSLALLYMFNIGVCPDLRPEKAPEGDSLYRTIFLASKTMLMGLDMGISALHGESKQLFSLKSIIMCKIKSK